MSEIRSIKKKNKNLTIKLTLSAILSALGVVLGGLNPFSYFGVQMKVFPFAHTINVLSGVLLGPWYAVAIGTVIAIIRFATGLGTLNAFPGGIPGGLIVGLIAMLLNKKDQKLRIYAAFTEWIGTVVIGASISFYIVSGGFNSLMFWWGAFAMSCVPGAIIGFLVLLYFQKENRPVMGLFETRRKSVVQKSIKSAEQKFEFEDLFGKSVLITGESGKGKTRLTSRFIEYLMKEIDAKHSIHNNSNYQIFILDFAPERFKNKGRFIGGKLTDFLENLTFFGKISYIDFQNIVPPRSIANSKEEVLKASKQNYDQINPEFTRILKIVEECFNKSEKKDIILIINDLSIFFHHGTADALIDLISAKKQDCIFTLVANSYEGEKLILDMNSGISQKEKNNVSKIQNAVDIHIPLR